MLSRYHWLLPKTAFTLTPLEGAAIANAAVNVFGAFQGGSDGYSAKAAAQDISNYKHQIQWRVEDANKAGIHPLYALGNPGSIPATQVIPGQSNTGSRVADAASRGLRDYAAVQQSPLDEAAIRSSDAMASYYTAMARNISQSAGASNDSVAQDFPNMPVRTGSTPPTSGAVPQGFVQPKAPDQVSTKIGDPSKSAAKNPLFMDVVYNKRGDSIEVIQAEEVSEALQDVYPVALSIAKNLGFLEGESAWKVIDRLITKRYKNLGKKYMNEIKRAMKLIGQKERYW